MPKKCLGLLIAGLLLTVPASAGAAVSVRAESGGAGALLSSVVTPTSGQVTGNGGAFTCSGTNTAAGALNAATAGDWAGKEFFGDFQVGRITSVDYTTASTADYYWSFNVNEVPASAGVCGTTVAADDRLLFYKACNNAVSGCYSGTILGVSGPAAATPGAAATFTVEEVVTTYAPPDFLPVTTRTPANAATVQAAGQSVTTGADGKAAFALPAGPYAIRATRASDVPGQSDLCVTTGSDDACVPVSAAAKPAKSESKITSIKHGKKFKGRGPRLLKGVVRAGRSGIKEVRLRLTRKMGDRCWSFDGDEAKFIVDSCGVRYAKFFLAGTGSDFSYLLPKRLGKGQYILDVQVVDKNESRTKWFVNGSNRVKFSVN